MVSEGFTRWQSWMGRERCFMIRWSCFVVLLFCVGSLIVGACEKFNNFADEFC